MGHRARLSADERHHVTTFPDIADYAFLSDCEISTLVAPDGSVEWLCLPRPDSPSVFGALLDRAGGNFRFGPSGIDVPNQRRYVPGTNVLETTWHTPTGWLIVWDLLVMGPAPTDERRDREGLARLVGAGEDPRSRVASVPRAQRARVEVAQLRADRGDHGCRYHVAPGVTGWRTQLGLPLHLDPRHRVHVARASRPRV